MKILIYRIGSFGDAVIAIPALSYIRSKYPKGKIVLLTNTPSAVTSKEISIQDILLSAGIIDEVIFYNSKLHLFIYIIPSIACNGYRYLYYLMPVRSLMQSIRDFIVFKLALISNIKGIIFTSERFNKFDLNRNLWEYEGSRLLRSIGAPGEYATSYSLDQLSINSIPYIVDGDVPIALPSSYIVLNLGGKFPVKDWGDANWTILLNSIAINFPEINFVVIGAKDEKDRVERLSKFCGIKFINLCGQTSPLHALSVIKNAEVFIGHDSGPMHLAAAVNIRLIAIFSSIAKPGIWFPIGINSNVFYNDVECKGCGLTSCVINKAKCIKNISPIDVYDQFVIIMQKKKLEKI